MAKQIAPPRTHKWIETPIVDGAGREILVVTYAVDEEERGGATFERTRAPNLVLADGTVWNPSMLRGDKPAGLAQCAECQKPGHDQGANGLMLAKNGVRCSKCGAQLCPHHRKRLGKAWLCPSCRRVHAVLNPIRSLLRAVFFKEED